jgi:plasmid stability protein
MTTKVAEQEKFILRLPDGVRDALKASAAANHRSMNAEILVRLGLEPEDEVEAKAFHADTHEPPAKLDLLWGALEIAKALNLPSRRKAFYMLENGLIPAKKVGREWVASRSALAAFFAFPL